jgi:hypothetical protein
MPSPAVSRGTTVLGWIIFVGMLACLVLGFSASSAARWIFGVIFALSMVLLIMNRRQIGLLRDEKNRESWCSFVGALPSGAYDVWIVRAVYEELSREMNVPLHPSDDVRRFWGFDGDDLDDIAFRIAPRAHRSMDDAQNNPMYDRVVTAADIITFFEYQPKLSDDLPELVDSPVGLI